jgi:acetoin utilization deacetylase AcuC-like enzyme
VVAVSLVSIHQSPLYPGSGAAGDAGAGPGAGYTVNLPVPPGSGDETFASLVADVVVPLARAYAPGLVLVSAGFDAHADDPLADCRVSDDGYRTMAAQLLGVAGELGVPLGVVLEGGYDLGALTRGLGAVLEVLAGSGFVPDAVAEHPLAVAARVRLRERWPELG